MKHTKGITGLIIALLLTIFFSNVQAQWSLSGNSLSGSEKLGSTNSADLKIVTNNNTRMTIKSNGKVGIGTTSPAARMEIKYNSTASDPTLLLTESENDYPRLSFQNTTNPNYWSISGYTNTANNLSNLSFYNSVSGNLMTLSGDGIMNIGGPAVNYTMTTINNNNNSSQTLAIEGGYRALNVHTRGVETLGYGDSSAVAGTFTADNLNSYNNIGLQVYAKNAANQNAFYPINTGMYCSGVSSYTTDYGGVNTGINCYGSGKGNINYGLYASANYATTNYAIYGTYYAGISGTNYAGFFNGNIGGTGVFSYTSDEKLKKDIKPESGMLGQIMKLQPRNYSFKTGEFGAMNLASGLHHGLIAQQLNEVFPELVSEQVFPAQYDEKSHKLIQEAVTYLGVNYIELIPVLISGMQEQQKQIEELKSSLNNLKTTTGSTSLSNTMESSHTPAGSYLLQNTPNPFSQVSEIRYMIDANVKSASIIVRNLNGNTLKSFDHLTPGAGAVSITAGSLPSGTCTYTLLIDGTPVETRNLVIIR